jgi:RpiR family carbohydrate utilization transcriptional regulator
MTDNSSLGCLDRIRNSYAKLNSAEKKVAKYILENPKDIIHFSITELADSSGVSESTVFRMCNKLGYKGYQDLKISLAGAIVEPLKNIHEEISEEDDMYIISQKILHSNIYSLENTMKINESSNIEKAVDLISKANQLIFFGMGGSGAIVLDAYHKFIRTGINCVVQTDSHMQAMFAAMSKENDVMLAVSNSGSNKELMDSITIARNNGTKIISITGNAKSPIAKASDVVLVSYGKESMFRSEAMESRLSSLMLIDCLYVGVALRRKKETLETLKKVREGIAVKRF